MMLKEITRSWGKNKTKQKNRPENLEAQVPSFCLSSITILQSDLQQVTCLCGLIPSLLDGLEDSFQFWHDVLLNSLILLDALLEYLLKFLCLKNNLFEVASFWPPNIFACIPCTGPTQETMPMGGLQPRVFLLAALLLILSTDPINQDFFPRSYALEAPILALLFPTEWQVWQDLPNWNLLSLFRSSSPYPGNPEWVWVCFQGLLGLLLLSLPLRTGCIAQNVVKKKLFGICVWSCGQGLDM